MAYRTDALHAHRKIDDELIELMTSSQSKPTALPDELRKKIRVKICTPVIEADIGKRFELEVQLDNESDLAISSEGPQRIFFAYHWVDNEGNY